MLSAVTLNWTRLRATRWGFLQYNKQYSQFIVLLLHYEKRKEKIGQIKIKMNRVLAGCIKLIIKTIWIYLSVEKKESVVRIQAWWNSSAVKAWNSIYCSCHSSLKVRAKGWVHTVHWEEDLHKAHNFTEDIFTFPEAAFFLYSWHQFGRKIRLFSFFSVKTFIWVC